MFYLTKFGRTKPIDKNQAFSLLQQHVGAVSYALVALIRGFPVCFDSMMLTYIERS